MSGKYWDKAWSLVDGCTKVSPGCDHCWLKDMDKRFHPKNLEGVTPRYDRLEIPLRVKKPTIWAVWSDLFHEAVPTDFIEKAFGVMGQLPGHTFLVLTKRPERALAMMPDIIDATQDLVFGFDNVYFGTTAENQEQADKRIPILLQIPAAHRFVSIEPMLSAINIDQYLRCPVCGYTPYDVGLHMDHRLCKGPGPGLSWVVLGGETGHGARPMHPDWVRSVRDQCVSARVPFFFKSWGEWKPIARCYEERECPDQPGVIDGDWPLSEVADWENQAKEIIALEPSGDIPHWSHRDKYFVHYQPSPNAYWMVRAGKKKAGRLLDGREWSEVPW